MQEALTWEDREKKEGFSWSVYERRVYELSKYIANEDKTVLDLGAGAMFLKTLLPEKMTYYPVDYKSRCDETIVCDFNNKEFPDIHADVAFCSGVLEYIEDTEWFFDKLAAHTNKAILSYVVYRHPTNVSDRRSHGWVSDLTASDIIKAFAKRGFSLSVSKVHAKWQMLFCFQKSLPDENRCTGCGACKNICPVDAIDMLENDEGFLMPHINEKCVHCHKCTDICPVYKLDKENNPKPQIYAARAADDLRAVSSSGGIFSLMAEKLFEKGGYVCGAAFDGDFVLRHMLISSNDQMSGLRGSKYLQSNTGLAYREIKEKLADSKAVLFTGCPCQVAGLYAYLGKDYENLYTVDLLCHGVPSQRLFSKYLHETSDGKKVDNVQFRPKKYGWKPGPLIVTYKDGSTLEAEFTDQKSYGWGIHPSSF